MDDHGLDRLKMTEQERNLYNHHYNNLIGPGKIKNSDGSVSTVLQVPMESDGKFYNIPLVWEGRRLTPQAAFARAKAQGLHSWPSYPDEKSADARYAQMHSLFDADVASYEAP